METPRDTSMNNLDNMKKCPSWEKCSLNLCPLDYELRLRVGGKGDKCKWMREPISKKFSGREFISGGSVMPGAFLILTPRINIKWLNEVSQKRYKEITKQK